MAEPRQTTESGGITETIQENAASDLQLGKTPSVEIAVEDPEDRISCWTRSVEQTELVVGNFLRRHKKTFMIGLWCIFFIAYLSYFSYCMYYRFGDEGSFILLGMTIVLVLICLFKLKYRFEISFGLSEKIEPWYNRKNTERVRFVLRFLLYAVAVVVLIVTLAVDTLHNNPENLQSLIGIAVIIIICFVTSVRPSRVNWYPVFWGFMLQFIVASFVLRTNAGYNVFKWTGDLIKEFLDYSDYGAAFVFGKDFKAMGVIFSVGGAIIFFNSVISALNYIGVIEFIVLNIGGFLSFCLETGPVESVVAAASIFMGISESGPMVRPYLESVTKAELHAVMTCAFASISGSTLALFIRFGVPANHLLAASVISAPAALALSRLSYPETELPFRPSKRLSITTRKIANRTLLSTVVDGAVLAIKLLGYICAILCAFYSLLKLVDAVLNWFGNRAGYGGFSFELICSYILWPLAYAMGTRPEDCGQVGALIGVKIFATPMIAYSHLGTIIKNRERLEAYEAATNGTGNWHWDRFDVILEDTNTKLTHGILSEKSIVIASYAMCGLCALTGLGMTLGVMIPLCPQRKEEIIQLIVRAVIIGNLACFCTASIAGLMYTDEV